MTAINRYGRQTVELDGGSWCHGRTTRCCGFLCGAWCPGRGIRRGVAGGGSVGRGIGRSRGIGWSRGVCWFWRRRNRRRFGRGWRDRRSRSCAFNHLGVIDQPVSAHGLTTLDGDIVDVPAAKTVRVASDVKRHLT